MTGKVFEIRRFAVHDGPGIRTTVFLKGCGLSCIWCHNPEGISHNPAIGYIEQKCVGCGECAVVCPVAAHRMEDRSHIFNRANCIGCGKCAAACLGGALMFYGRKMTVVELLATILEDRVFYQKSGGGVTLSGGEPLMQTDFCVELLKQLKAKNIHTAVDTSGFASREKFTRLMPYTDLFLFDIKHIDEEKHKIYTGQSNKLILENLHYLNNNGAAVEIRIPLIPNVNDDAEGMNKTGAFLSQLPQIQKVKVLPYNSLAGSKYLSLGMENTLPIVAPPTDNKINEILSILKKYGLNAVSGRQ